VDSFHTAQSEKIKKYFLRPVDGFFILVFFFFFGLKILRKAIPTRHSPIKFLQIVLRPYASLAFHSAIDSPPNTTTAGQPTGPPSCVRYELSIPEELHEECVLGPVNQFLRPFD
jgi:hypothetical protein